MTPLSLILIALLSDTKTLSDSDLAVAAFGPPIFAGIIDQPVLNEASGLAPSRLRDDVLFSHNDSGNEPLLFAFGMDGRNLGAMRVNRQNVDWEDMASYLLDEQSWLLIADIGDNRAQRSHVVLHFLHEPAAGMDGRYQGMIEPEFSLEVEYPDGAKDAESVAVDLQRREVLILSKRIKPSRLYSVPIKASSTRITATLLGEVPHIPQPTADDLRRSPEVGRWRSQPTAMDIVGNQAAVLTYWNIYVFERGPGQSWPEAFAQQPKIIWMPPLPQAEALSFDRTGRSLFVTTEKQPTPLLRLDRR